MVDADVPSCALHPVVLLEPAGRLLGEADASVVAYAAAYADDERFVGGICGWTVFVGDGDHAGECL